MQALIVASTPCFINSQLGSERASLRGHCLTPTARRPRTCPPGHPIPSNIATPLLHPSCACAGRLLRVVCDAGSQDKARTPEGGGASRGIAQLKVFGNHPKQVRSISGNHIKGKPATATGIWDAVGSSQVTCSCGTWSVNQATYKITPAAVVDTTCTVGVAAWAFAQSTGSATKALWIKNIIIQASLHNA